ncbi:MAG: hypothetical protein RMN53_08070 [Anaerolineae bacterium]|nr:hypothetical protein [Anaerolineae bacterium]
MDTTTALLILIGVLVLYVIYLQIKLIIFPRQTLVVVPQNTDDGRAGCAAEALAVLLILVAIAVAAIVELPAIL